MVMVNGDEHWHGDGAVGKQIWRIFPLFPFPYFSFPFFFPLFFFSFILEFRQILSTRMVRIMTHVY